MLRVSATTLESFRLFMEPDQDWMTEDELIATIQGRFQPTPAVALGLAFGKVLEQPDRYETDDLAYVCNGFTFDAADIGGALRLIDRRGVFEAKASKTYGRAHVVTKADHLYGAHLSEFKTTGSSFNFDKYAQSCQWRFMADIFEARRITYHVFVLDDHGNGVVDLKSIESFDLYPYAEMRHDCQALVDQFVDYVEAKGLADLLRERQRAAEAAA